MPRKPSGVFAGQSDDLEFRHITPPDLSWLATRDEPLGARYLTGVWIQSGSIFLNSSFGRILKAGSQCPNGYYNGFHDESLPSPLSSLDIRPRGQYGFSTVIFASFFLECMCFLQVGLRSRWTPKYFAESARVIALSSESRDHLALCRTCGTLRCEYCGNWLGFMIGSSIFWVSSSSVK